MAKHKVKDRRFKPPSPPPTPPVPLERQCDYKAQDPSWMPKCSKAADLMLVHDELDPDEPPKFCAQHFGPAMVEIIGDPGCGIDQLTILYRGVMIHG